MSTGQREPVPHMDRPQRSKSRDPRNHCSIKDFGYLTKQGQNRRRFKKKVLDLGNVSLKIRMSMIWLVSAVMAEEELLPPPLIILPSQDGAEGIVISPFLQNMCGFKENESGSKDPAL